MFLVYWTAYEHAVKTPKSQEFPSNEMTQALKFTESLRKQQFDGAAINFITLVSENPDSVGKPGVDVTGPDYYWKKRRQ